jgi:phosphoenolpyruvate carboxykinase (GTP)
MNFYQKIKTSSYAEFVVLCQEFFKPTNTVIINGLAGQKADLMQQAVQQKLFTVLDAKNWPNCYAYNSDPSDVSRTEHLTFVCTHNPHIAGVNNNWKDPAEAIELATQICAGAYQGKTMYVIPFAMGQLGSDFCQFGVEITDSLYIAISMMTMSKVTPMVEQAIQQGALYTKCLHCLVGLKPENKYILHFPQDCVVWSMGSGYGGNAILSKKSLALRLASYYGYQASLPIATTATSMQPRTQTGGWMAEHMLLIGLETPQHKIYYMAAAFPSGCGKTNLAFLQVPRHYQGYKIWTLGDDICWIRNYNGKLYAMNPENGFFGIAKGVSRAKSPNILKTIQKNTVFTNVAITNQNQPWWEGLEKNDALDGILEGIDWKQEPWLSNNGKPGAHPNSRFTVSCDECETLSAENTNIQGVPLSAIIFGGRRPDTQPLVSQSASWTQGVFMGATIASQTNATIAGPQGVLRRDPMAMLPFCGYAMKDYWQHWLNMEKTQTNPVPIFTVNWFIEQNNQYIWPGFGENIAVLEWIIGRLENTVSGVRTPIGILPKPAELQWPQTVTADIQNALLRVCPSQWDTELKAVQEFFTRMEAPQALWMEHANIESAFKTNKQTT